MWLWLRVYIDYRGCYSIKEASFSKIQAGCNKAVMDVKQEETEVHCICRTGTRHVPAMFPWTRREPLLGVGAHVCTSCHPTSLMVRVQEGVYYGVSCEISAHSSSRKQSHLNTQPLPPAPAAFSEKLQPQYIQPWRQQVREEAFRS